VPEPAPDPAEAVAAADPDIAPSARAPRQAPRPEPRPARVRDIAAAAAPAPAPTPAAAERRDIAFPPPGTPLIQLGAFDTPEVAQAEWQRLLRLHGDLLGTKGPLIQRTQSSGRVFFRLRAEGFEDLADARSTCAALTARGAACIPARQE
ncbi:MAG: SPOR domain-containing protein, partial [Alphaproteobacteria bacterium]